MKAPHASKLILIMGIAGCGKSTVGAALASALACPFIEADDYHSPEAREKMRAGTPLNDDDRWPWLERVAVAAKSELKTHDNAVIACSALKKTYRTHLAEHTAHALTIFHLSLDPVGITARMTGRAGHFMPTSLIQSQFATLEPPEAAENAITIDATAPINQIVQKILAALQ